MFCELVRQLSVHNEIVDFLIDPDLLTSRQCLARAVNVEGPRRKAEGLTLNRVGLLLSAQQIAPLDQD